MPPPAFYVYGLVCISDRTYNFPYPYYIMIFSFYQLLLSYKNVQIKRAAAVMLWPLLLFIYRCCPCCLPSAYKNKALPARYAFPFRPVLWRCIWPCGASLSFRVHFPASLRLACRCCPCARLQACFKIALSLAARFLSAWQQDRQKARRLRVSV